MKRWTDDPCDEVSAPWFPASATAPMIDDIQRAVALAFHVDLGEMKGQRRLREFARPRQVAMYLARRLTRRSLPEIGIRFGGRDHTTVIHAVKQIEKLRKIDVDLDGRVRTLIWHFEGAAAWQ